MNDAVRQDEVRVSLALSIHIRAVERRCRSCGSGERGFLGILRVETELPVAVIVPRQVTVVLANRETVLDDILVIDHS